MSLQKIYEEFGESVKVIGTNTNDLYSYEYLNGKDWRGSLGLQYDISNFEHFGKYRKYYTNFTTPMTIIVGKDMKLYWSKFGYENLDNFKMEVENAISDFFDITLVKRNDLQYASTDFSVNLSEYFESTKGNEISYSISDQTSDWDFSLVDNFIYTNPLSDILSSVTIKVETEIDTREFIFEFIHYPSDDSYSFENGFENVWSTLGTNTWKISRDYGFLGSNCAQSGEIESSQNPDSTTFTSLKLTKTFYDDVKLNFIYKVSCDTDGDSLIFKIDGNEHSLPKGNKGEVFWSHADFDLQAGNHEIEWIYSKDIYYQSGNDFVLLDAVYFNSPTDISESTPNTNILSVFPNPFNPTTSISFRTDRDHKYSIMIYNVFGQLVYHSSGRGDGSLQKKIFNGSNYSSGIYSVIYKYEDSLEMKKIVLVK
ncbi:MAG: T9SS type A sorting domain-containing protein [Candidatus Delongbacteria bacterium]|nr:T9SS type A sorting domain-containing protein [Candidatus Delongbacteria bacterium]